ncbi:ketopantoate reductase family protein [Priestia aryabhattai]|uniref:ketopantoate reductase family protein n=1 Tax=Priestia aryabhattai TaxID=412384 RepID=UPI003D2BA046
MRILIFGAGVIGSIYGYTLQKAGFDVTHYIRPSSMKQLDKGLILNLLDGRNKKKLENITDTYKMNIINELPSFNEFDLILISVKHYQLNNILPIISKKMGKANILFFNHLWTDFETIDKYIPREKYLWGFPSAGGGFDYQDANKLNGVIMDQVYLGEINGDVTPRMKTIKQMFNMANIRVSYQQNILHWLWKQFALNAGISSMITKSGGAKQFMSDFSSMHEGVLCIREILKICKSRGVNMKEFGDARAFFLPSWIATFGFWITMKTNKPQRTIFQLYNGAEEIKQVYYNVLDTSEELNVSMPVFHNLKDNVDRVEELYQKK